MISLENPSFHPLISRLCYKARVQANEVLPFHPCMTILKLCALMVVITSTGVLLKANQLPEKLSL